jgi:hypothetical protein
MTTATKILALASALVIGGATLATAAEAAPLPPAATKVAGGSAVETIKLKLKKVPHHHGLSGGEAAMIGLGAFALGAALANSAAYAAPPVVCTREKVRVWSPAYQAWVVRTETVCE